MKSVPIEVWDEIVELAQALHSLMFEDGEENTIVNQELECLGGQAEIERLRCLVDVEYVEFAYGEESE